MDLTALDSLPRFETVEKPWGRYTDLFRSGDLVLKVIEIDSGEMTSYQEHSQRSETWYVKSGLGVARINDREYPLTPGEKLSVWITDKHQMVNTGSGPLVIYEMQNGVCDESDIVRYNDPYQDRR